MPAINWKRKENWVPALFLLLGLLLVLALGVASHRNDNDRITLETRITAEQVKIRLESCFDSRGNVIRTLASYPWENQRQVMETWSDRAGTLLPLYSGVQALNYVDPDWTIRVVYPAETNQPALNASLRENTNVSVLSALGLAETTAQTTRTDIIELLQSGKGFALYRQIHATDGRAIGFVNGVFRVRDLMDSCLAENRLRDNFEFALFEEQTRFYQQPDTIADASSPYLAVVLIDVPGRAWRMTLAPLQSYLDATDSIVEEVWIGLALLLTTMLTFAMRILLIKQGVLADNQDKYRLLVENQTDMVVKVDPTGAFQYVSPSYCEVFGRTERELLGKQFLPLVHEDDRELTNRSLESLNYPPHASYHEQRAMTKNGWRWLAWSNRAVLDTNGKIEAITAVGRDVTKVKRLEENIAHSRKMTAMGELAGGITHDFNNLLQVILGNIEFLQIVGEHDAATKESLEQVCKVVDRAMKLTQKLATLSRQEMVLQEVFDLNQFSQEIMVLLKHTLPASVSLSLTLPDEPLRIRGDKGQLEQVLLNLCFNARDAIESSGHIRIQLHQHVLDRRSLDHRPDVEPGEYVLITIEDDGHGIDPAIIPRIFDPFFTTKSSGTGTGLGLANCYSIVKQHKGMILVDSTPGAGTCFSVYLPLTHAASNVAEAKPAVAGKPVGNEERLVLIADDNPELLELTCRILEAQGFETLRAADGKTAVELYESNRRHICLVILDLVMPQMSGQDVAKKIRLLCDSVKILFVSGYVPDDLAESLEEPIIKKPYKIEVLLRAVNELLTP